MGNRHEQGRKPAYVAHIEAPHDGVFRVTYRRFYPTYREFRFEGGKVTYSPVSPSQTDVSTYDPSTDSITITGTGASRSFTLMRAKP